MDLTLAVSGEDVLRIDGEEYRVTFPLPRVAELETRINRSMKHPANWFMLATAEVPEALRIGLMEHHAEAADAVAKNIAANLKAEALDRVIWFLCGVACPEATRHAIEEGKKQQERMRAGILKNALSGSAAVAV